MRNLTILLALAALSLVAVGAVGAAGAKDAYTFRAVMNTGQEVPKPTGIKPGESGLFTAAESANGKLRWKLTFTKLTGPASAAHIHIGKRGKAGPVAIALCGPCRSGQTGTVKVPAKYQETLEHGGAYVNVHTAKNAGGEIRGQLTAKET
jgi:hypothetical protein